MKKHALLLLCLNLLISISYAQKPTIIQVNNPGTLGSCIKEKQKRKITHLTVTGTIDARDFRMMKDSLPLLSVLNISNVTITQFGTGIVDLDNAIPEFAFCNKKNNKGKVSLTSIILPTSITKISESAFEGCEGLTSIVIPASVTFIDDFAFAHCSNLESITIQSYVPFEIRFSSFLLTTKQCPKRTVHVPLGSKSAYEIKANWKEFKNIVEL